jgi:hypothetical protein
MMMEAEIISETLDAKYIQTGLTPKNVFLRKIFGPIRDTISEGGGAIKNCTNCIENRKL